MSYSGIIAFILIIIIFIIMFVRTLYLMQLYGLKRFFLYFSNILYLISVVLGSAAIIMLISHLYFDLFSDQNIYKEEMEDKFVNIYGAVARERLLIGIIALFTGFAVIRLLFLWFFSPNFDLLRQTFSYSRGVLFKIIVFCFCFCLIFYHYLPNLMQNPSMASYSTAFTYGFNFRQLTKNIMFPGSIFLEFVLCVIFSVGYFLSRLLILFFYSISRYNHSHNLFHEIDKRRLGSVVFDQKYKPEDIKAKAASKGVKDSPLLYDPFYKSPSITLSERRIRKMKFVAISNLLNMRKESK